MTLAVVFVCTDNMGAQINVATHLVANVQVSSFRYIMLSDNYAVAPAAKLYVNKIVNSLKALSLGEYNGSSVDLNAEAARMYGMTAEFLQGPRLSVYSAMLSNVKDCLREATAGVGPSDVIVDVTGLTKPQAAHIMHTCMFLRFRVHSFELAVIPDRRNPARSLYHLLKSPSQFAYPCLADVSAVTQEMNKFISKRTLGVAISLVCVIAIACIALLIWMKPDSGVVSRTLLWIGLVANVLGILAGLLQIATSGRSKWD